VMLRKQPTPRHAALFEARHVRERERERAVPSPPASMYACTSSSDLALHGGARLPNVEARCGSRELFFPASACCNGKQSAALPVRRLGYIERA
jgi:hypothetical protein